MISKNIYLKFDTFDSEKSVLNFVKEEQNFNSNSKTWKEDIQKLLRYKKQHLRKYGKENHYRNIYGYYLKILIPQNMKNKVEEFARKVMIEIDRRFLRNLYVYKIVNEGKGMYLEIICFSRYVFKKGQKRTKTYQRDYYYDSETKKLCKKDNPRAVLISKKGDPLLDKNGDVIKEVMEVKQVEDRIFVYKTIQQLTRRLKQAVVSVIKNDQYHEMIISIVSRITIQDEDSLAIKHLKMKRNKEIKKINDMVKLFIQNLQLGKLASDEDIERINEEWCQELDMMTHEKNHSFDEIKNYLMNWWNDNIISLMF